MDTKHNTTRLNK